MSRPRRLATLAASLALHAAALLAVVLFVTRESELGALYIDLTRWADTEVGGGAIAAGGAAPAAVADGAPRAVARTARASRALEALAPRHAPPAAAEAPPAEPWHPAPLAPAPAPPAAAPERPPARPLVAAEPGDDALPGPGGSAAAAGGGAPSVAGGTPGGVGVRGGGGVGAAPDVSHGLALAAPGTGGAGGPGAEYGAYLTRLRRRVQESLRYPPAARRRGLQGTVALDIVIHPDGRFGAIAVTDSSAHAVLDEAALEAVRRLAPEPFPPGVTPRLLRVRLPVVFALE